MKRWTKIFGLILTCLANALKAEPPRAMEAQPSRLLLSSDDVSLPMESFEGRPLVQVQVNGKGPFPFVLDTAATQGCLGAKTVRELGLEPVGEAMARSGAGKAIPLKLYKVTSLRLPGVEIQNLTAVGWAPDDDSRPNILPVSAFADVLLTLDFPAEKIVLRHGELPAADGQSTFDYTGRLLSIKASLGGVPVTLHPDSGASGGIAVPQDLAASLPLVAPPKAKGKAQTINTELDILEAQLKGKAQWGRSTLESPSLRVIPGLREPLIGAQVLRHFVLSVDQKNHRIRFLEAGTPAAERSQQPAKP